MNCNMKITGLWFLVHSPVIYIWKFNRQKMVTAHRLTYRNSECWWAARKATFYAELWFHESDIRDQATRTYGPDVGMDK